MDFWHDIVKSYDDPMSKDPGRKDDGTYSQASVVILLIYLTFGEDYPYHINKYFNRLFYKPLDPDVNISYASNLRTAKVGILLNKMKEDELVNITEIKAKGRLRKIYSINPRIIQSPTRGETYIKRDGSAFEIPLEIVEQFLPWRDLQWQEHKQYSGRGGFFNHVVFLDTIDFLFFIKIVQILAAQQNSDRNRNFNCEPNSFEKMLEDYYEEVEYHINAKDELSKDQCQKYFNPFTRRMEEIPSGEK